MASHLKTPATLLQIPFAFGATATAPQLMVDRVDRVAVGGAAGSLTGIYDDRGAGHVDVTLTGGREGERYAVTISMQDQDSQVRETIDVLIITDEWQMPDGQPGWLTIGDFAMKFGIEETVTATDNGSGTIDRTYLVGALQDAQAEVEVNMASAGYALGSAVPVIVKTIIADLARARLYPRGLPDGVADQAKVQRRFLERLTSGQVRLPMAGMPGEQIEPDGPGVQGFTGCSAYPDGLKGY